MSTQRELYKQQSNWVRGAHYAPIGDEVELLAKLGMYHAKRNKLGLVRDHVFPRYGGFKFRVFPELLRHPANCRFIPCSDNMAKAKNDYAVDPSGIEDLFRRIEAWRPQDGQIWKEHAVCLELIRAYRRGDCYDPGSRKRNPKKSKAEPVRARNLDWPPSTDQKQLEKEQQAMEFAEFTIKRRGQLSAYEESRAGHVGLRDDLDRICATIKEEAERAKRRRRR